MSRNTFIVAGGFDERFIGWGGDDDAFVHALETLCGNYIKLGREVFHLWHPRTDWCCFKIKLDHFIIVLLHKLRPIVED